LRSGNLEKKDSQSPCSKGGEEVAFLRGGIRLHVCQEDFLSYINKVAETFKQRGRETFHSFPGLEMGGIRVPFFLKRRGGGIRETPGTGGERGSFYFRTSG